jgi:hypothetical protein
VDFDFGGFWWILQITIAFDYMNIDALKQNQMNIVQYSARTTPIFIYYYYVIDNIWGFL